MAAERALLDALARVIRQAQLLTVETRSVYGTSKPSDSIAVRAQALADATEHMLQLAREGAVRGANPFAPEALEAIVASLSEQARLTREQRQAIAAPAEEDDELFAALDAEEEAPAAPAGAAGPHPEEDDDELFAPVGLS